MTRRGVAVAKYALDKKSTSSEQCGGIALPYLCAINVEGKNRGEEGEEDTCDNGFVQNLESRGVWKIQYKIERRGVVGVMQNREEV